MKRIRAKKDKADSDKITDEQAMKIYNNDNQQFSDFTSGKSKIMDFARIKRLILSELSLNKSIRPHRIFTFTRQQILNMCQYPERYGTQILKLMDYIYQKSGYMRRLIDYFFKYV